MIDSSQSWDWEGNVQEVVAAHLVSEGWRIVAMADTATREQGVDLEARRGGEVLLVEVKGYPQTVYARGPKKGQPKPTNPSTQARHWYASALLTALLHREKRPEATIALAFPAYETYTSLVRRTRSSVNALGLTLFFVTSDGAVLTGTLDPGKRPDGSDSS